MKKIINGKTYNTETATKLAGWGNGYSCSDFNYCRERLYRTKKGAYFIWGTGGPMSKYAECYGDCRGGGEDIVPVKENEAKRWMERHGTAEEYEQAFGPCEEA